jgi:hypothetical protein
MDNIFLECEILLTKGRNKGDLEIFMYKKRRPLASSLFRLE